MIRSALVTFFMLTCALTAVYFMGVAYSAMEMTVTGKEVKFFDITENEVSFFGKSFKFDFELLTAGLKKAAAYFSGGIIKLLAIVKNGCGELSYLIGYFK